MVRWQFFQPHGWQLGGAVGPGRFEVVHFVAYGMMDLSRKCMATHILRLFFRTPGSLN